MPVKFRAYIGEKWGKLPEVPIVPYDMVGKTLLGPYERSISSPSRWRKLPIKIYPLGQWMGSNPRTCANSIEP